MAVHRFVPSRFHNTFATHEPVLTVMSGDVVHTSTVDAAGRDARDEVVAERGNPLTGPICVPDAEPGDTLIVNIRSVRPNRERGFSSATLAPVSVDPAYVWELERTVRRIDWRIDIGSETVGPADPIQGLEGLMLPLAPMLGCIGVAPDRRQAIVSATSGRHGGNMDYRRIGPGTTMRFPVLTHGALLYIGDAHAAQGAGELTGTGIEVSADVELQIHCERGVSADAAVGWPRGETADTLFTLGNARPLDQALQHATTEMVRWLRSTYDLSIEAASILIGQASDCHLGNMFDPAYTMVSVLEKRYLPLIEPG